MSDGLLLRDALDRWAAERPDAPALVDGSSTLGWRALRERAATLAAWIADAAPRSPGDGRPLRIALEPPATALGVVALHAALRLPAEAILVPPRWSDAEVADLVARTRPALLVSGRRPDGVAWLDPAGVAGGPLPAAGGPPPAAGLDRPGAGSVLATLVVPTSGTTARPRLVRLPLAVVEASAHAWSAVLPPATAWLLSLGLAHVAGIGIVARAALAGVPAVIPDPAAPLRDAFETAADDGALRGPPVSHASLVATQMARLLDATRDACPPASVRAVLLGGGPVPPALVSRALEAGWPVWPTYGSTETASGVAAATPAMALAHPWTAGVALPGAELRVADPAGPARPLPPGTRGELQVRGPMVAPGDLDPGPSGEDGARRRTPDGFLRSGDLAELDAAGRLRVLDRLDDVIISGGENVGPAEVEAVLAAQRGVREVAVVGAPDPTWGQVPVAVVAPVVGADPADADLLAAAGERLAAFRRPATIMRVAALPRGGTEKVLRRTLRTPVAAARALSPAPAGERGPDLETRLVLADDGQPLVVRAAPQAADDARPAVLLLHATLSSSTQLLRLAAELAPDARVLLLDRRGSGDSRMAAPAPVPVARHAADAALVLAACGEPVAVVVGHSFGGVVALELAGRHPACVRAVAAWEPPYVPLAPEPDRSALERVAALVARTHAARGPVGAARVFMDVVSPGAWERLRPAQQETLGRQGDGVLADAAMTGLDAATLDAVRAPVVLGTGGASEPFYAAIARAIAGRIPGARVEILPDLRHFAPILSAASVAALIRPLLTPGPPHQERIP